MPLANKKTAVKMTPIKNPILLNDLGPGPVIRPTRKIPLMTPLKSPVSFAGASGGVIRSTAPPRQNVKKYKK